MITPQVVGHKAYTPALLTRQMFLSARCVKKPGGYADSDNISWVSHVSVKQRMLQSLMSLWKATLARISSTLLLHSFLRTRSEATISVSAILLGDIPLCSLAATRFVTCCHKKRPTSVEQTPCKNNIQLKSELYNKPLPNTFKLMFSHFLTFNPSKNPLSKVS